MKKAFLIIWFFASSLGFGTTSGINFVYQPVTTMGTDEDPAIIVAKIPVIAVGEPENLIKYISMPLKLQPHAFGHVGDSNLLSSLKIEVSGELVSERESAVTLNLSAMEPTDSLEVTDDAVVKAALDCIRRTIDEIGGKKTWKIRILCREQDRPKWSKYETAYRPKTRK
jgi:hypothetical protein